MFYYKGSKQRVPREAQEQTEDSLKWSKTLSTSPSVSDAALSLYMTRPIHPQKRHL